MKSIWEDHMQETEFDAAELIELDVATFELVAGGLKAQWMDEPKP